MVRLTIAVTYGAMDRTFVDKVEIALFVASMS